MKTRNDRNVEMIRTGIKIVINMLKDSNWQSRPYERTDEQYKQRDGNPKKIKKKHCNRSEDCL